jgi:hypothetical protein
MPAAKNPKKHEFFVYRLVADFVPYYVGIGRSARASDRIKYVQYMMARKKKGKPVKWTISTSATATLLRRKCHVEVTYSAIGLTRKDALLAELADIESLLERGVVLANIQNNRQRVSSHRQVVAAVLARRTKAIR